MRHQDQQTHDDHAEVVKSDPVPVTTPDDSTDRRDDMSQGRADATPSGDRFDGSRDDLDDDEAHGGDEALGDRLADARRTDVFNDDPVPGDRMDDPTDPTDPTDLDDRDRDRDDLDRDGLDRDQSARTDEPDPLNDSDRIDGAPIGEPDGEDQDRPEFHEPAPAPTTFGASTVGGAAAAAALANPDPAREPDPRDDSTARPGDGEAADRIDGVGDDRTDRGPSAVPENAVITPVGEPTPDTVGNQPVGEAAPATTELMPGDVPAEPVAALLADDATQGFRNRWRDVQLRFVDDPRAAAGEAQGLVEEAIESLAAALAAQKDDLGGWQNGESGDTEQLRVVVRRYRDFLDRLLGL
jgi:hypothetical protein